MITFRVSLAGVAVEINCQSEYNRAFFEGFETDKTPEFCVRASEKDLSEMRAALIKRDGVAPSEALIENSALHRLIAQEMLNFDALLLHGSAISMDGEGVIFTAPSGTGKSTHAANWRKAFGGRVIMINDDKPLIRRRESGFEVWGSPWMGKHRLGSNIVSPLKAIVALERGRENETELLSGADMFSVLAKQSFLGVSPEERLKSLELRQALVESVRCLRLKCNMDVSSAIKAYEGIFDSREQNDV